MNRGTSLTYVLHMLDTFTKREGHACVPAAHTEQDLRLGDAVEHLRKVRAEGVLPVAAAAKIQARPGWYWGPGETRTHKIIAAIGGYISLHGHTRFKTGSQLEQLANDFRAQLEAGALDRDTFLALQSFPQWRWEVAGDRGWSDRFQELIEFSEQAGHARIPTDGSRAQLVNWAVSQRSSHRAGTLMPSRKARLDMIQEWEWQPASGMREKYLTELIVYVEINGHAEVPKEYTTPEGFPLGDAVYRVRRLHQRGELPARRAADLEAVPGWSWTIPAGRRDTMRSTAAAFQSFVDREGHANVPSTHTENGVRLGATLASARHRLRNGTLGRALLEQLDGVHSGWRGTASPAMAQQDSSAA